MVGSFNIIVLNSTVGKGSTATPRHMAGESAGYLTASDVGIETSINPAAVIRQRCGYLFKKSGSTQATSGQRRRLTQLARTWNYRFFAISHCSCYLRWAGEKTVVLSRSGGPGASSGVTSSMPLHEEQLAGGQLVLRSEEKVRTKGWRPRFKLVLRSQRVLSLEVPALEGSADSAPVRAAVDAWCAVLQQAIDTADATSGRTTPRPPRAGATPSRPSAPWEEEEVDKGQEDEEELAPPPPIVPAATALLSQQQDGLPAGGGGDSTSSSSEAFFDVASAEGEGEGAAAPSVIARPSPVADLGGAHHHSRPTKGVWPPRLAVGAGWGDEKDGQPLASAAAAAARRPVSAGPSTESALLLRLQSYYKQQVTAALQTSGPLHDEDFGLIKSRGGDSTAIAIAQTLQQQQPR